MQVLNFCRAITSRPGAAHVGLYSCLSSKVDGVPIKQFSNVFRIADELNRAQDRALRHTAVHGYRIGVAIGSRKRLSPLRQVRLKPIHCSTLNGEPVT